MSDIFGSTTRPLAGFFTRSSDRHDIRLGEVVSADPAGYESADIIIVGCPSDLGSVRAGIPAGAAKAPDEIRRHFYELTNFGIHRRVLDLGNIVADGELEEVNDRLRAVAERVIGDGKRLIVLGGSGDTALPNGQAMASVFGRDRWLGLNVDARFDIAERDLPDCETSFRRLLDAGDLMPKHLYEIAFQPHFVSPSHYRYLVECEAQLINLQMLRSRDAADTELRETIRQEFIHHSRTMNVFFCFDMQALRASEAPGVTRANPFGLRAGEFLTLARFAAELVNTKIIEFSEVNPLFDHNGQTSKLVAVAMHVVCSAKL